MSRVRGIVAVLLAFGIVVACVGSDPETRPSSISPGEDAGGPGAGGCAATEKPCNGQCVPTNDPRTGCADTLCTPCIAESAPFAVPSCDPAGKCGFACQTGHTDCDKEQRNGCETPTIDDENNCGTCGNLCGSAGTSKAPVCELGKCVLSCTPNRAHCGTDDAKGCETDLLTDGDHCGACGHSCLGAACASGACAAIPLATGLHASDLAVDATNVYFTIESGTVRRIPKTGPACAGAACPSLVGGTPGYTDPDGIATDGTVVVWGNNGSNDMARAKTDGAEFMLFAPNSGMLVQSGSVAITGMFVFWIDAEKTPGRLFRAKLDGTGVTALSTTDTASQGGVATDGTNVYWTSTARSRIYRAAVGAGTSCAETTAAAAGDCAIVAATGDVFFIAVDNASVYWTEPLAGKVRQVPKIGGTIVDLGLAQVMPLSIATDGVHVYWGNFGGDNTYRRTKVGVPCSGAACEIFATATLPNSIVLDDKAAYYVSKVPAGGVFKKAK